MRWGELLARREDEKAPPDLERYFEALNTAKIHPNTVDKAVQILDELLEADGNLNRWLDRNFDRDENYEYDTLPKRRSTIQVYVPFKRAQVKANESPDVFPEGLGMTQKANREQWRGRYVETTKKMLIVEVIKEYLDDPGQFPNARWPEASNVDVGPSINPYDTPMGKLLRK